MQLLMPSLVRDVIERAFTVIDSSRMQKLSISERSRTFEPTLKSVRMNMKLIAALYSYSACIGSYSERIERAFKDLSNDTRVKGVGITSYMKNY